MNIKTQTESPYNPEVLSVVFSAVLYYQAKSSRRFIKESIPDIPLYALKPEGGADLSAGIFPETAVMSVAERNFPFLS